MDGLDETIHQPVRLRLMAALTALPPSAEGLEFARLKSLTGATAVIQPGGSMRDADVIAAADAAGIAMVFTGMRHFRH